MVENNFSIHVSTIAFQYKQRLSILTDPKHNQSFMDHICIIFRPVEQIKRVANSCKERFCQCKSQK